MMVNQPGQGPISPGGRLKVLFRTTRVVYWVNVSQSSGAGSLRLSRVQCAGSLRLSRVQGRLTFVVINYYMYTVQYTIHDTNKLSKTFVKMNMPWDSCSVINTGRSREHGGPCYLKKEFLLTSLDYRKHISETGINQEPAKTILRR